MSYIHSHHMVNTSKIDSTSSLLNICSCPGVAMALAQVLGAQLTSWHALLVPNAAENPARDSPN